MINSDGPEQSHESWAVLAIHHCQGGSKPLFGSSIRHSNTVRLTITRATQTRHLNQEWIHASPSQELIEIEMSPVQWAEAITHMNCGVGTPVTLRHVSRKRMPDCPETHERAVIEEEFAKRMQKIANDVASGNKRISELLQKKGALTVAEKKEITDVTERLKMEIGSNLPFVHSQFNEAVEKTVTQAKGEIESFYTHAVMNAGKNALGITYEKPEVPMLTDQHEHVSD